MNIPSKVNFVSFTRPEVLPFDRDRLYTGSLNHRPFTNHLLRLRRETTVDERKDHYWRKAKQEGFRSRAAYKLLEIQKRFGIFRKGDRVVDLGCAPGGWLQVIAAEVGPGGKAVGVDRQKVKALACENVTLLQVDITKPEVQNRIRESLGEDAHVVTSDLSPKLTGIGFQHHHPNCELEKDEMDLARTMHRTGDVFMAKDYHG